ncbi:MAG: GTPase Era [Bryobacteraceae bacterium]|nr:GTPase Era [Bryobacteraceae bacterium]MDW8377223.1 GTPase Era [Bryobacterales bacterium]
MDPTKTNFRSGFVAILGRPNAGKSTLLNALLGAKLAIVADKPQTTRTSILGVWTEMPSKNRPGAQIIFLDTPGINEPKTLLHQRMNAKIREALNGRDVILFVVDASRPFSKADEEALQWIHGLSTPVVLVLNKIDALASKATLLPLMAHYNGLREFAEIIPISALTLDGVERVREAILSRLPPGPQYFPADYLTNQPERFLAAELIREKILHYTHQEVPHAVAVLVDQWEETQSRAGPLTRILATIHVEKPGQKTIIVGKKGEMLKQIGTAARLEIERLLNRKVYLELFVKVSEHWRDRPQFLNELEQSALSHMDDAP